MGNDLAVFEPTNLREASDLCVRLSRTGLVPETFRGKPDDLLLVVMAGKEMGFSFVQSMRSFYALKGKLAMYADSMVAVCLRHPECEYFRMISSTEEAAVYETKRKGSELVRLAYSMDQAKRSGLQGQNQNYNKHPAAMLRARCGAALARIVYPDALAGIYDPSELEDSPAAAVAQVAPGGTPAAAGPAVTAGDVIDMVVEAVKAPEMSPEPEFSRPEFDDDSPEQKKHVEERSYDEMKVAGGPYKGQLLAAQPLDWLIKAREHLNDLIENRDRRTFPNLAQRNAMDYHIAKKQAEVPAAVSPAESETWAETPTK